LGRLQLKKRSWSPKEVFSIPAEKKSRVKVVWNGRNWKRSHPGLKREPYLRKSMHGTSKRRKGKTKNRDITQDGDSEARRQLHQGSKRGEALIGKGLDGTRRGEEDWREDNVYEAMN